MVLNSEFWTAFSAIATFLAVIVALIPLFTALVNKIVRKKGLIIQLYYIFEDINFLLETEEAISTENIDKWYFEINIIINDNITYLPYVIVKELSHFLFLIRIYDKSEEAKQDILQSSNKNHKILAKQNSDWQKELRKIKKKNA